MSASYPGSQPSRILAAIAEGCEASREIADASGIERRLVSILLLRLEARGEVERAEPVPTFWAEQSRNLMFRWRLAGRRA